jgi:hypothetical protein
MPSLATQRLQTPRAGQSLSLQRWQPCRDVTTEIQMCQIMVQDRRENRTDMTHTAEKVTSFMHSRTLMMRLPGSARRARIARCPVETHDVDWDQRSQDNTKKEKAGNGLLFPGAAWY